MTQITLIDVYEGTRIRQGALEFLYRLLEERSRESSISHREMPSFEHHRAFWTRRPYRFAFLIEPSGYLPREDLKWPWCGYVSATGRNEIGIHIALAWQRRGLGTAAVQAFMAEHYPNPEIHGERVGAWVANINPQNERSKAMFERLGFRKTQETFQHLEEGPDAEDATDTH